MKKDEKIFIYDDLFPQINSNEQFDAYKVAHPEFDPEYILEHCYVHRQETRNWLESIWEKYNNYAEPNFLDRLRAVDGFHPFSWQMYLASVILEKNYKLQPNRGLGPDLQIKIGNKNIWMEAVITTPGGDETSAGLPKSGAIYDGLDPRVARISNALTKKYEKYLSKYRGSVCKENEPFIVAINGCNTNTLDAIRAAEATVYGRGNDMLIRAADGTTKGGFYELREAIEIKKESGQAKIQTNYFCNDSFKEISGIIYCEEHVINANNNERTPEDNLYFLLNPFATNKINLEEFKIGKVAYMNENRQIIRDYERIS